MRLRGAPYPAAPRALVAAGVARVPADRRGIGSVGDLSLAENAVLERLRTRRFAGAGWLKRGAMRTPLVAKASRRFMASKSASRVFSLAQSPASPPG